MGYCYSWGVNSLGGFWWLVPVAFWGLIIFAMVYLIRSVKKNRSNNSALKILKKEYALGSISHEEFLERKKNLQDIK
jgi:putative membrane protein